MRILLDAKSTVVGLPAGVLLTLTLAAAVSSPEPKPVEYQVATTPYNRAMLETGLNQDGLRGWEVAAISGSATNMFVIMRRDKR